MLSYPIQFQRRRSVAGVALLAVMPLARAAYAAVPVEQVEALAYSQSLNSPPYAPIDFGGASSVTETSGPFAGISFYADAASGTGQGMSTHAQAVGDYFYASGLSPGYSFISSVYCISADQFLYSDILPQGRTTSTGVLPLTFASGVKVINNSYVSQGNSTAAYQDVDRRLDYMINQADVVWVAAAVTGGSDVGSAEYEMWSNFNGLAVTGLQNSEQNFSPAGSPGKQHADLSVLSLEASFATATVSGYAAALWGNAQANNQADAQHGIVIRSLLMTGADHGTWTRPADSADGALDPVYGAGQADYTNSLLILNGGQTQIVPAGSSGPIATNGRSWAIGNVQAGGQSVLMFQTLGINGLTACLNWNVTSTASATTLDTTNAGLLFPNLSLEICPLTVNNGQYTLGSPEDDPTLQSAVVGDNVQYLSSTAHLPAGTYAFVIGGDPNLSTTVALTYSFGGSFSTQWNGSGGGGGDSWGNVNNWQAGIPGGSAAQAVFADPANPTTVTLDGNRTVGGLTFNSASSFTLTPGSGGTLTIDDSNSSTGVANPLIAVLAGSHTITAPISLASSLTVTVASGSALTITGVITGNGGLLKTGAGILRLSAAESYGSTNISGGTLLLDAAASVNTLPIIVASGGTLELGATSGGGIFVRSYPISLQPDGGLVLDPAVTPASRQLLVSSGLSIAGSSGNWAGRIDLANNDLDIPAGNLANITSQLREGIAGGWNAAAGIVSSAAVSDTTHLSALGVIQNNQSGTAAFTASNTFDGTTPGASDILIKYTTYGDANLDGAVDQSDYNRINAAFAADQSNPNAATGWYNGDFNYDGVIDGSDFTLIDAAYLAQGDSSVPAMTTELIATPVAVPESAGALVVLSSLLLLLRSAGSPRRTAA